MDRALRRADVFEHDIEERAVLQQLDRIAFDRHAQRKAGKRGDQLLERQLRAHVEVRVMVPLDRPDGEAEQRNDGEQQPDQNIRAEGELGYLPAR